MKKLILLAVLTAFASCSTDDIQPVNVESQQPQTEQPQQPEEPEQPVADNSIPEWLIGEFVPVEQPETAHSVITNNLFDINLRVFDAPRFILELNYVEVVKTDTTYQITTHPEEYSLVFSRMSDTEISITYITNGVTYDYGLFKKLN